MNSNELETISSKEKDSIPKIIELYGSKVNDLDYAELLNAAKEKNCLEAQFVSYFDKFDAAGEAWHEVWAGNKYFTLSAGGKNGKNGGYVRRLNEFPLKYPKMKEFFEKFQEYLPKEFDFNNIAEKGRLHTVESLKEDSKYPLYEKWKKTIIKREGIDFLLNQIEYL